MGKQELKQYSYCLSYTYWPHDQSNSGGNLRGLQQIVGNKTQSDYTLAALLLIFNEKHRKCFC